MLFSHDLAARPLVKTIFNRMVDAALQTTALQTKLCHPLIQSPKPSILKLYCGIAHIQYKKKLNSGNALQTKNTKKK